MVPHKMLSPDASLSEWFLILLFLSSRCFFSFGSFLVPLHYSNLKFLVKCFLQRIFLLSLFLHFFLFFLADFADSNLSDVLRSAPVLSLHTGFHPLLPFLSRSVRRDPRLDHDVPSRSHERYIPSSADHWNCPRIHRSDPDPNANVFG